MKIKKTLSIILSISIIFSLISLCNFQASAYEKVEYKFGTFCDSNGYKLVARGSSWTIGPVTGVYDDYVTSVDWSTSNSSVVRLNSPSSRSRYCSVTASGTGTCTVNGCVESYYPLMADLRYQDNIENFRVVAPIISLTSSNMTMDIHSKRTFSLEHSPSSDYSLFACKPTFSSSNTNVATVDRLGVISALKPGKTTITVTTSNGLKTSSVITVKIPKLEKIILSSNCELLKGRSTKLTATLSPYGATGNIKWSSNKRNIVKVDKYGNIKGVNSGKAKITASVGNKIKATCLVTVHKAPKKVKLIKKKLNLRTDETFDLTYKLKPVKAKTEFTWSSSNSDVAWVNNSGRVYPSKPGKTVITLNTHNKLKAKCKVNVKYPDAKSIKLNESELTFNIKDLRSQKLKATVSPNPYNGTLKWVSSNDSVATVDSEGYVTPVGLGNCIITAKINSNIYAECSVEVNDDPLVAKNYISFKHVNTSNFNNMADYGSVILKDTSGLGITLCNYRTKVEETADGSYVYVNEVVAYNDYGEKTDKAYNADSIFLNCSKKFEVNNITTFEFYFIFDGVKYVAHDSEIWGVTFAKAD